MYYGNGTYYTEEHTISFANEAGEGFTEIANTWTTWHLIPSSYPVISNPVVEPKLIAVPGSDEPIDLTTYLTGSAWPNWATRDGSLNFMIANGFDSVENIRTDIVTALHGKRLKMRLSDYPDYYYIGRFTVETVEPGEANSTVTIKYQLDPNLVAIENE